MWKRGAGERGAQGGEVGNVVATFPKRRDDAPTGVVCSF